MKKLNPKTNVRRRRQSHSRAIAASNGVASKSKRVRNLDAEAAWLKANEFCLFHYPTLYRGGPPRLVQTTNGPLWQVPIVLASPTLGILGNVGELKIDVKTGAVLSSTQRGKVVAAGKRLYAGRSDAAADRPGKR
jgi:hypothetical protein